MTVTIKKNVDVQATLEAKQFKYQVKRNLSGDVQFENMASPPTVNTQVTAFSGTKNTTTGTIATNDGWNFINPAKIKLTVYVYAGFSEPQATARGKAYWLTNNNVRASVSATASCSALFTCTDTTTTTINPANITVAQASPNQIKNKAIATLVSYSASAATARVTVNDIVVGQKNQKVTIMK